MTLPCLRHSYDRNESMEIRWALQANRIEV
ncbi:uncharacterized protein G2W53_024205 [Senna tora]|uniref:Uncharacterized protein n=1 Tax=Senna tora TaxID=362788 RepID=A0A834WCW8_9FABA|nr:uncharacterized protein G2W53_024205 [Senna tora]